MQLPPLNSPQGTKHKVWKESNVYFLGVIFICIYKLDFVKYLVILSAQPVLNDFRELGGIELIFSLDDKFDMVKSLGFHFVQF